MQSRTSFFNKTLFRQNLTRFWPLWALASFGGALFPLAFMVNVVNGGGVRDPLAMREVYYAVVCYALPVVSLLYALLCAMCVWSYLYAPRSVGLMHTLPIRREGLFVTNFLSGMTMMAIPYCIVGAMVVLLSLLFRLLDPLGIFVTVLSVIGQSFFYFASATVVAFITGNLFALPALYLIFHFLAVGTDFLVSTLSTQFIFGLNGDYSGAVEFLSPTVYLMRNLDLKRTYESLETGYSGVGGAYVSKLSNVTLENGHLIAVYALVGAALTACAYLLYRRRRTESAGDVVSVGWMKPVFCWGVTVMCAISGGQLLYELFRDAARSSSTRYAGPIGMAVAMAVCGVIGYYAARMLLAKSLRVFRGSWKGAAVLIALCFVCCLTLHYDLLGFGNRVPRLEEVQRIALDVAENNYVFYPDEEAELSEQILQLHHALIADSAYQKANGDYRLVSDRSTIKYLYFTYELKNGRRIQRTYRTFLTQPRMEQSGTLDNQLQQLIDSPEMKRKRLYAEDPHHQVMGGDLNVQRSSTSYDLSSREAQAILDAVMLDRESWGNYDWFDLDGWETHYALGLSLTFEEEFEDGHAQWHYITIIIRPDMTHTIQCLKDLGFANDKDFITWRELDELNAREHTEYYEDVYDNGEPMEVIEAIGEGASSVGVIGGADGPTAVFVTGEDGSRTFVMQNG